MQSKLPVRISRKHAPPEKKCCCCSKFFEVMLENSGDTSCQLCARRGHSLEDIKTHGKLLNSRSTQTNITDNFFEAEIKSFSQIQTMLHSINSTLESILSILKNKKEHLHKTAYAQLREEYAQNKVKTVYNLKRQSKCKIEKIKKKTNSRLLVIKKQAVGWPDIGRLYSQTPWTKNYMQKMAFRAALKESNAFLFSRSYSSIYPGRPSSCPDIKYFQTLGKLCERKHSFGIALCSNPLFSLIGQGDLKGMDNLKIEDTSNEDKVNGMIQDPPMIILKDVEDIDTFD